MHQLRVNFKFSFVKLNYLNKVKFLFLIKMHQISRRIELVEDFLISQVCLGYGYP